MRPRTVALIAIVAVVNLGIKIHFHLLESHQSLWVLIGTSAIFWGTLAVVGYFSERSSRSKSS